MTAPIHPSVHAEYEARKVENYKAQANWALRETRRLKEEAKMYQEKTAHLRQASQAVRSETARKEAEIRRLEGNTRHELKTSFLDSANNQRKINKLVSTITGMEPISVSAPNSMPRANQTELDALKKRRVEAVAKYNSLVASVCAMADTPVLELALEQLREKVENHKSMEEWHAVEADNARLQALADTLKGEIERFQAITEVNCTMAEVSQGDCTMVDECETPAQLPHLQFDSSQTEAGLPNGLGSIPSWSPHALSRPLVSSPDLSPMRGAARAGPRGAAVGLRPLSFGMRPPSPLRGGTLSPLRNRTTRVILVPITPVRVNSRLNI